MCFIHLQESLELHLARQTPATSFGSTVPAVDDELRMDAVAPKRKASQDLERGPAKRPKVSSEDEEDNLTSPATCTVSTDASALREVAAKQAARVQRLETELDESEYHQHELTARLYQWDDKISRLELLDLQRDEAQHRELSSAVKKLENINKEKWTSRLHAQKVVYEGRLADAQAQFKVKIAAKHQSYQDKVDELKDQHEEAIQAKQEAHQKRIEEFKSKQAEALTAEKVAFEKKMGWNREKSQKVAADAKKFAAGKAAESKAIKEEYATLTRAAKAELKEALAKAKPEQSDTVKEKNAMIKKQSSELHQLQSNLDASQKHSKTREDTIKSLESDKKALEATIEQNSMEVAALQADVTAKGIELDSATSIHDYEKDNLLDRVEREEKRWQVQYNAAQNTAALLKDQQRANFELRNMASRRDQRIGALTADLESVRAELELSKGGAGAEMLTDVGVGGESDEVEAAGTVGGEVVDAVGGPTGHGDELEQQP
ncbi:hypothetical protein LTR78_002608 [Recurvomyces mirabilis]|uniref:Uncharacterized protein n=1 Tax=Recurvomyces mirabilis TaxID=574656 RepID=A0AAE1C4G4_9PEZI|nr:hypothetical protein LTR78_002608 [Recurvomyces mirabilis]KAK5157537.1 hypothetical protein LTS14_004302 [Recurvomyces mirabilis]